MNDDCTTQPWAEPAACMAALICENAVLARQLAAAQARSGGTPNTASPAPHDLKRRRKLHELPLHAQDLLLAMSFQPATLRAEIERALGRLQGQPVQLQGTEADVLYSSLHDLGSRNALSDALHKRLEARHAATVRRLGQLRDGDALRSAWQDGLQGRVEPATGVAGLLWALLTHPLGPAQEVRALAEARSWIFQQARRGLAGTAQAETAQAQVLGLQEELVQLRLRLQQQQQAHADALQQVREDAARAVGQARRSVAGPLVVAAERPRPASLPKPLRSAAAAPLQLAVPAVPALAAVPAPHARSPRPVQGQRVLCVGGIQHAVARYRSRIEDLGGRFEHHDGGVEDSAQALNGQLARADLVICQAGCINHAAYQRIKQHCQRTGKPCMYLERASLSRFDRALAALQPAAAAATKRPAFAGPVQTSR